MNNIGKNKIKTLAIFFSAILFSIGIISGTKATHAQRTVEKRHIEIECTDPDLSESIEGFVEDRLRSDLIVVVRRDGTKYYLSGDCVVKETKF